MSSSSGRMLLGLVARRRPPPGIASAAASAAAASTGPTARGGAGCNGPAALVLMGRGYHHHHHQYHSSTRRRRPLADVVGGVGGSGGDWLLSRRRREEEGRQHVGMGMGMGMRPLMLGRRGFATGPEGRIVDVVAREVSTTTTTTAVTAVDAAGAASASASAGSTSPFLDGSLSSQLLALSGAAEGAAAATMETLGNWPSDWAIRGIELLHQTSGLPYWLTIVSLTLAMRTLLFPLVVTTARNAAKMTLMRPEMDAITERIKAAPMGDRAVQQRYQKELYGLFDKYQCSPFRSFVGPLANIALFVPMFFGLRRMGVDVAVPGFNEGGIEWFVDLGAADPTYILPAAVTLGFLAVTEIGMDGIQMQVNAQMKFIFRVLPVVFLPITAQMPAGCLLYWGSSNLFSIGQTLLLRNPAVKRHFGIPEIPKKVRDNAAQANPFKQLLDQYEERKKTKAIADAEILHGGRRPPPPPPPSGGGGAAFAKHPGLRATPPRPPSGGKK